MTALSERFLLTIICDIFSLPILTFLLFSQVRKPILDKEDIIELFLQHDSDDYDDCLFVAIILSGFHTLLHVGELMQPDSVAECSFVKLSLCNTLKLSHNHYSYHLPYHKGDRFFDGNTVMIDSLTVASCCPVCCMTKYIALRNAHFPTFPELWLTSSGDTPSYSWVITHLHTMLGQEVGGHSLQSGGATALALAGISDDIIQLMGHWASDTFRIYICKHPVLLHALIHNKSAFTPA